MASIEQELEYDQEQEIVLEVDKRVVVVENEEKIAKSNKLAQCILCPVKAKHPGRHAIEEHMPWYYSPHTACWVCRKQEVREQRLHYHVKENHREEEKCFWDIEEYGESWTELMNGLFREVATTLGLDYPEQFQRFVNDTLEEVRVPRNLTKEQQSLATVFNQRNGLPPCQGKRLKPKMYQIHSLLQWKAFAVIISKLSVDQQQWLRQFEEYKSPAGLTHSQLGMKLSGPISIADSHFHMDSLMTRTGCSGFHELSDYGTGEFYKTCLTFMVANYCFPSSWPNSAQRTEIRKVPSIHFSFGIHPRAVESISSSNLQEKLQDLEQLLKSTRTVAVGECGLDTSDRSYNVNKQIKYLEKQLLLAVSKELAVVIHCRGDESLHRVLLSTLIKCCPKQQAIHWHCFTSTQEIYQAALDHFENIVSGITPFIFNNRYSNIKEIIKKNGIDRLVLETDAPYIQHRENQIPNPYVVNFIADEISKLLSVPVEKVFTTTFSNTQRIYGKKQ